MGYLRVSFNKYHHNHSIIKTSFYTLLEEVVRWETPQTDHPTREDGALSVSVSMCPRLILLLLPPCGCRVFFIPCWQLLCFGERVRELSSARTWGPSLAHPPDLLLLLGRHRRILRLLLRDKELLGYLPFMSLFHFHVLVIISLNLSVESILTAQNYLCSESILDIHMERKFVMKISIISLVSIY